MLENADGENSSAKCSKLRRPSSPWRETAAPNTL
jgi:hypothetical protein